MSIFNWLTSLAAESAPADTGSALQTILMELNSLPRERAEHLASIAFILSRVARSDLEVHDAEVQALQGILGKEVELTETEAHTVAELAIEAGHRHGGTDNYNVVRDYSRTASLDEKRHLLRCLFLVAAADGSISTTEATTIRQISDELRLDRHEYTAVRSAFRDYLEVLN
jgi:uncharacterized tellurite resistance protein B-like protein